MDDAIDHAVRGDLEFFKEAPREILLNARGSYDSTVLAIAANYDHLDCCDVICERCPTLLCQQTLLVSPPLHYAAHKGNLDQLKLFISTCEKADLENQQDIEGQGGDRAQLQKALTLRTPTYGTNAMHSAVLGRQPESVKLLIAADPNNDLLRALDTHNYTPLHRALESKELEIAKLLIEADPDFPYGANRNGDTPLLFAIKYAQSPYSDRGMLELILQLQPSQSMVSVNENGWKALHYCVSKKYLDAIGFIIWSCPESTKVADNEGQNFFQFAVKLGSVEMVKHILRMKEITQEVLNSTDNLGRTPLDVASESQNESMILCLLEDPRVDLNWVVEKHNFVMIKMLMEIDAYFLMKVDLDIIRNSVDENGDTLLFKAAQENHLFLCQGLYKRCPSLIYHQSKGGRTALHHAAWRGEPEMLKFLIDAGTKSYNKYAEDDIESRGGEKIPQKMLLTMLDDKGDTALHKAVLNQKLKAVKLLVEADPDCEYGANNSRDTPIRISIREARSNENKFDSGEIRRLLFKMQPRQTMAHRGENGWTSLLHQATYEEDLSIIEDIVKFCTGYLDVVDSNGKNFLHIAAELEKIEVVKLVLRAKDIPDDVFYKEDMDGNTPMHIAAKKTENKPLMGCFLFDNRFIKIMPRREENCWTKLHQAASDGDLGIIKDIIKWTSCLDGEDNEGKNFLHIAAEFEKVEVVKMILRVKDIPEDVLNHQDKDGNTPFHIAALTGNEPLTRCFLFDKRVVKTILNETGEKALHAIKFPYDKRKAGVVGIAHTVDQRDLKEQSDFDMVVGALIATVSFAAGITVPGGYISDGPNRGTAVFSERVSFATFTISNTFALMSSLYAVFSHYCARRMLVEADIKFQLKVATYCTLAAMCCMMVAFIAGSFAALASWLAILKCIISCFFFIFAFRPMWKIAKQRKRGTFESQH